LSKYKYAILIGLICIIFSFAVSGVNAKETTSIKVAEDAAVFEGRPDLNRGSADYLYVGVGCYKYGYASRTWLKFDLSTLPDGIVITKAELRIYFERIVSWGDGAPGGISLYFSSDDTWSETMITWNNQPSLSFTGGLVTTIPQNLYDGWVSFDVTSYVAGQYSEDKVTSWCLCAANEEGEGRNFNTADSKERSSTHAPYLYVEYETGPQFVIPITPYGTAAIIATAVTAFSAVVLLSKRKTSRYSAPH